MTIAVRRVPGPPPAAMRTAHLAALEEPQGLYLERRIAGGSTWLLEHGGSPAGYGVVEDDGTLLELFYSDALAPEPAHLFTALTAGAGVKSCLYQSFDPRMVKLAAAIEARIEPVGILFRRIRDPRHWTRSDASMRPAGRADLTTIASIDDGFFADDAEIGRYLDMKGLWVLESATSRIMGCGITEPVMTGGADIDVGMLVAPDFRCRGYGAFIVSHLKFHLVSKGLRPICGCAIDNVGSQRAIQNAGFEPDHRLLAIKSWRVSG